jgi:aminopeptidase N
MGIGQSYLDSTAQKLNYERVNFRINYRTATDKFMKGSSIYASAKQLDGLNAYILGFDRKDISGKNKVYMYFKSMYRNEFRDLTYLLLPQEWIPNKLNNTINIGIEHTYNYRIGTGNINLGMRSSAIMSDYNYQSLSLNVINKTRLGKLVLNTRLYGQYGTGNNWAKESSLFLAGANPEEMMDNKYTRSQGFFDPSWASIGTTTNKFQYGGGLNLRGYSGYLAPQIQSDGTIALTYKGQTGTAVNAELEFSGLVKIKKQNWLTNTFKLTTYLFGDAGTINYNTVNDVVLKMSDIRIDAGLGGALTIKKFGVLQTANPLTIRFDMPLFLNKMPATDKNYIQYRFVVGVSRAF